MADADTPGTGVEPQELAAILDGLIGDPADDEHDLAWYAHLTSRQALLTAAVDEVAGMRARALAGLHAQGQSYGQIAAVTGLTRGRVQQLVERGRPPA
jgi:DNA-directed RNA polymerase specialized sigma24 family protein